MRIAIDLRGLNFSSRTGINTLNLHLLYQFYLVKKDSADLKKYLVTGLGLRKSQQTVLKEEFPWFDDLFDDHISIFQYLKLPKMCDKEALIKPINGLLDCIFNASGGLFDFITRSWEVTDFDVLWLPQPKGLIVNKKTKVILSIHDLYALFDRYSLPPAQRLRESKKLYQNLINASNLIMTISRATAKDIENNFDSANIKLYYPALPIWPQISNNKIVNLIRNDISNLVNSKKEYIFAVSGIEYRKNWINLIYAHLLNIKTKKDYDYVLILSGIDIFNQFQSIIKSVEVSDNFNLTEIATSKVLFFENINEEEKNLLIKNSLFMAYPSLYEGFGFPILEAFSFSKSVLTSKISSMPEIAQNGALYVNPLDINDISSGLYILSKDSNYRLRLEENSQKRLKDFDWIEFQKFFKEILTNLDR